MSQPSCSSTELTVSDDAPVAEFCFPLTVDDPKWAENYAQLKDHLQKACYGVLKGQAEYGGFGLDRGGFAIYRRKEDGPDAPRRNGVHFTLRLDFVLPLSDDDAATFLGRTKLERHTRRADQKEQNLYTCRPSPPTTEALLSAIAQAVKEAAEEQNN